MFDRYCILILCCVLFGQIGCSDIKTGEITEKNPEIQANLVFLYYRDLAQAQKFYEEVLGFERVLDYGFATVHQISKSSFIGLVDETEGMHKSDEPKSVTLAIVSEEVEEWYGYLKQAGVEMRHELDVESGSAHDGFVALDPEGYFLEFERFNDHHENEKLIPLLRNHTGLYPAKDSVSGRPEDLGVLSTVFWLYYQNLEEANRFYNEKFGFELLVRQSYSTIFSNGSGSFVGLVDEAKGLHKYSDTKSVTISFITREIDRWYEILKNKNMEFRGEISDSSREPIRSFVTFDIGKYYIEFDQFYEDERNIKLLELLKGPADPQD